MLLQSRKKDLKSKYYVVLVFNANSATCTFFSDFSPQCKVPISYGLPKLYREARLFSLLRTLTTTIMFHHYMS